MRTAIYVHEPSTVTIRASSPRDANVRIYRYHQSPDRAAIGTYELARGIYLVVSAEALEVEGKNLEVEVMRKDKDSWPDPKVMLLALEPGASAASLKEFFQVAKDLSFDD